MIPRVRRQHRRACADSRKGLDDRQQKLLFGVRAMRLRVDNDLVFGIHRRHARVTVDDTLIGRHLRALVVRAMAFAEPASRATAMQMMRREPLAQLLRILRESRDPCGGLRRHIGFELQRIGRPVAVSRCRSSIVLAAVSSFSARCVNSARVPLRCVDAMLGNFTPSIANISRPISPCPSHTASTAAKTLAVSRGAATRVGRIAVP